MIDITQEQADAWASEHCHVEYRPASGAVRALYVLSFTFNGETYHLGVDAEHGLNGRHAALVRRTLARKYKSLELVSREKAIKVVLK